MSFFETAKIDGNQLIHQSYHVERIRRTIVFLKQEKLVDGVTLENWQNTILPDQLKKLQAPAVRIDFIKSEKGFVSQFHPRTPRIIDRPLLLLPVIDDSRNPQDPHWNYKLSDHQAIMYKKFVPPDGIDDLLICNKLGIVCETLRTNIYWKRGNELLTPPLANGVLAGTYRHWLLDQGKIEWNGQQLTPHQCEFSLSDLNSESYLLVSNALIGLVPAKLVC